MVGKAYSVQLLASGGTAPYIWSIQSGVLPTGLTLSTAGLILGTPTNVGTWTFTVLVTDSSTPTKSVAIKMKGAHVSKPL